MSPWVVRRTRLRTDPQVSDKKEEDGAVIDLGLERRRAAAKKERQRGDTKRSRNRKIEEALSKHGSSQGEAMKDRFKKGKIDIFSPTTEEDQKDGIPSKTD